MPPDHRHAVLVLAYAQPRVLASAVRRYAQLGWDTFVHVDAKIALGAYTEAMGDAAALCRFVADRRRVYWAGYSIVEASLSLMRAAANTAPPYDRFTLLSDDTLPLWTDERLREWQRSPWSWIELSLSSGDPAQRARYEEFHFLDHPLTERRLNPDLPCVDTEFIRAIKDIEALMAIGKKPVVAYHGSTWWSLTAARLRQLLEDVDGDLHLQRSFRYSDVPDERYFHTLVAARGTDGIIGTAACFAEWTRDPKPFVFSALKDLPPEADEHPFARKFAPDATT